MKKQEITKLDHALTFKRRSSRPHKNLILNQTKDFQKQASQTNKNKQHNTSDDGKSQTNISTKDKKSLPTLNPPTNLNPIRKIVAQKALTDYMKNIVVTNTFQDKQHLHEQVLKLKQRNNELTVENMKLKTKIKNLQSQNNKTQKLLQGDMEIKYPGSKQLKIKNNEQTINSLKAMMRQIKKQLNIVKEQNNKIKKTAKFTRVSELDIQIKTLQDELTRIRSLLQQQVVQNFSYKITSNSNSQLQQQCISLQRANVGLKKQIAEYSKKMKNFEQIYRTKPQVDKSHNRTISDLKKVIKEKHIEIESLKRNKQSIGNKQQRATVKSASLNKGKIVRSKCQQCTAHTNDIKKLKTRIQQLQDKLKTSNPSFEDITVKYPTKQQIEAVGNFLRYRFKAHHLAFEHITKYLIKNDSLTVTVGAMVDNLLAQPFFLIFPNYLENMIAYLFYSQAQNQIKVNQTFQKQSNHVRTLFCDLIKPYELIDPRKQQQIFIQIAQIVTNYCDHISAALDSKRNGEGTISQAALFQFLKHIELEQQYIKFIITQIVLQSTDLDHLNYYSLFEIFYLPNNFAGDNVPQAVKQLDQQYQQSQKSARIKIVQKQGLHIQEDEEYEQDFDLKQSNHKKIDEELYEQIPEIDEA